MNKLLKKSLSVILVILMIATAMPMAFAAEAEATVEYDGDPLVVVRGIDFAGLVDENGNKAITVEAFDISNIFLNFALNYVKKDKNAIINTITSLGCDIFKNVKLDKEGNPANPNVHIPKFPLSADNYDLSGDEWADTAVGLYRSLANKYGGENVYLYTFDWRMSPDKLADDLKSYLDNVKAETGADKLDVAACSMGGMITTSYIYKYGTDIFDSVFFFSGAHNGGHIVGSAFSGDLVIDNNGITEFLIAKTKGNFFVNLLVKLLKAFGILKKIVNFVNEALVEYKDKIYADFLRECLATAYGLWALIPDEEFDAAVDFFFDGVEDEYTTALAEIAKIRDFVFSTEETMAKLEASDVKFGYVSHYNARQLPIYSGFRAHGDGVLETDRTSGGAVVADFGKTLTAEQMAGVEAEYISPDKVVNAKTCLYADRTWIVKNAGHVGCKDGSDHTDFAIWLITQDTQPTVYTNPDYPRFMNCDANENFIGF
ncbi:MAG: hypothetical protein J6Q79_08345 [Clostridia bacterium]|nr:hypothetical protein [Clostridia bacterium]